MEGEVNGRVDGKKTSKQRKMLSAPTTPLNESVKLKPESKCTVLMMGSLALKSPPKKIKCQQGDVIKASLCNTVEFD